MNTANNSTDPLDSQRTISGRPHTGTENEATMPGVRDRRPDGSFRIGDRIIDRYKVLEELGQGGMGAVYKCFDETAGIEIALKALPPELSHNTLEMEDIKENFQLVHNLHHPNIASYNNLEKDNANGNYYLIMECVSGMNLHRWLRRQGHGKTVSADAAIPIIRQIAEALDYAHSEKILHRDIKPANIMLDQNGHVKVLDFGLASQIHTSMSRVSMSHRNTSGTAVYMAPEQWRGHSQQPATDQYALAATLYEMLAGHPPFECAEQDVLRSCVLNETPEPLKDVPEQISKAILRALAKDPAQRFSNCVAFAEALQGRQGRPKATAQTPDTAPNEYAEMQYHLGEMYWSGNGVPKNPEQAKKCFEEAAKQGHAAAQYRLAQIYAADAPSAEQAIYWYQQAAENGNVDAQRYLGELYAAKEPSKSVKWYLMAADHGDAVSQCKLAGVFEKSGNAAKARELYQKAAVQGYAEAQFRLGVMQEDGRGGDKDPGKAVAWYQAAAKLGHIEAQVKLAQYYEQGKGLPQDAGKAFEWYLKAAAKGNADAQFHAGEMYATGKGTAKDDARTWYLKAAAQGHQEAQFKAGKMLEYGFGGPKNIQEAGKWYRIVAEHGHREAQYRLALLLLDTDKGQARYWLRKAAEQGSEDAQQYLQKLKKEDEILIHKIKVAAGYCACILILIALILYGSHQYRQYQQRIAEEKRISEERRVAEEKRIAEERRIAEEKRKAEEEAKREAAEARRIAEAKKLAEAKRKAAEEAKRKAEEARRIAEEKRKAEEEAKRKAEEERRIAEEKRKAKEEAKRIAEEKRIVFSSDHKTLLKFPSDLNLTEYKIPDCVTSIGDNAFVDCINLSDIIIPDSVKIIGNSAFENCERLTSISIPKQVTSIGIKTFSNCPNLSKVIIPDTVTNIGDGAFSNCQNLTDVTIPSHITSIGNDAFNNCIKLSNITIPKNIKTIGHGTFTNCKSLKRVIIPDNIVSIGGYAFYNCSNLEVILPYDISHIYIAKSAFWGCLNAIESTINPKLEAQQKRIAEKKKIAEKIRNDGIIKARSDHEMYGIEFSDNFEVLLKYPHHIRLSKYEIPSCVISIGFDAFAGCRNLETIIIPSSVIYWGVSTFRECTNLKNVKIDEGVTFIGNDAFRECASLRSIVIPYSVTTIGAGAFFECKNLENVILYGVHTIGNETFMGCTNLKNIKLPRSISFIGKKVFTGCPCEQYVKENFGHLYK